MNIFCKSVKFQRIYPNKFVNVSHRTLRTRVLQYKQAAFQNIPIIGIAIGIMAFSFQIGVLYPWHHELSVQFDSLEVFISRYDKL